MDVTPVFIFFQGYIHMFKNNLEKAPANIFASGIKKQQQRSPELGEIALDTTRYRRGEKIQIQGVFQKRQCKLCTGTGEIRLKKEKMYVKKRYQNKTI